ncbi:PH domain-containing protein [Specibacter sp. RAF43]|uniref:PH domain-containing protein n=1 Tax=Specibacter sp. RAF43 TaxID=3233057 RepID=UPI003F95DE55
MRSWLADGEQLIVRCRPHPRMLVFPIAVGLLLVVAGSAALAWLQPGQFARWAPAGQAFRQPAIVLLLTVVLLVEAAYPLRRVVRWAGTKYLLTNQRMVVRQGLLRRRQQNYVFARVHHVGFRQKMRQRPVRAGELDFDMGPDGIRTIPDVPEIQQFVNFTHEAWTELFRASYQHPVMDAYYADGVGMTGKELRKLGRDH